MCTFLLRYLKLHSGDASSNLMLASTCQIVSLVPLCCVSRALPVYANHQSTSATVFQWPWQRWRLIGPHGTGSAARTTGCALAPPPRVEEFQEVIVLCGMVSGMQDVWLFFLFFVFYFSAALSHITRWRRRALKIIKFLWTREWHMECFWSLTSEFSCISHRRQMIGKKNKKHPNSFSDQQLATETDVRWTQSSRYNKQ